MLDDAFRLTLDIFNPVNDEKIHTNPFNDTKFSVDGYCDTENLWEPVNIKNFSHIKV